MKKWVYFDPGEEPVEVDEHDPSLTKEGTFILNSQTGMWFQVLGAKKTYARNYDEVPGEFKAWLLLL